jgi:hypothetical protein
LKVNIKMKVTEVINDKDEFVISLPKAKEIVWLLEGGGIITLEIVKEILP